MESVENAENHSFTRQILLIVTASFATCIILELIKAKRRMDNQSVLEEVERFLRTARLSNLIKIEDESYLRAVELAWLNNAYKGPIKKVSIDEWLRESKTSILSP